MITKEQIRSMLDEGASADTIMQSLTDVVNETLKDIEAEKTAKLQEENKKKNKREDFRWILEEVIEFNKKYFPELHKTIGEVELTDEEIDDTLKLYAETMNAFNSIAKLDEIFGSFSNSKEEDKEKKCGHGGKCHCKRDSKTLDDIDKILGDFINSIC